MLVHTRVGSPRLSGGKALHWMADRMPARSLLLIGTNRNTKLRRALRGRGLVPLGALNVQAVLRRVREGDVAAILVPRRHGEVDVLELVLNVRDIDPSTPILIVNGAGATDIDNAIVTVGRAVLLKDCEGPERLAAEVQQVLARRQGISDPQTPEAGGRCG